MKRKGFTLVELLVVISIIALLMAILMPALAKVKQLAHRMVCGTNLSGIGKSMIMYSTDNHDEYPIAGPPRFPRWWGTTLGWQSPNPAQVWQNSATITSSFYLLIKYADAQPKQFVCKGDVGSDIFELSHVTAAGLTVIIDDLTEAWDFGPEYGNLKPGKYCSYSYNMPYYGANSEVYPVSTVTNPGCAIAADRNPFFDKNAETYLVDSTLTIPYIDTTDDSYQDPDRKSSCAAHQRDGQNVLFNDSHVKFERFPNCGVNNDNIYNYWSTKTPTKAQREIGTFWTTLQSAHTLIWQPWAEEDSVLVNEVTY